MPQVILGLGTNMGDRLARLRRAVRQLADIGSDIRCSSVYESSALLPEDAPDEWDMTFLNMALVIETELPPQELLVELKLLEKQLGRERRGTWAPREIDIDILAYGDEGFEDATLTVPHPHMLKRDFVLLPLAEILPDWCYPNGESKGRSAQELVTMMGMKLSPTLRIFSEPIRLQFIDSAS